MVETGFRINGLQISFSKTKRILRTGCNYRLIRLQLHCEQKKKKKNPIYQSLRKTAVTQRTKRVLCTGCNYRLIRLQLHSERKESYVPVVIIV